MSIRGTFQRTAWYLMKRLGAVLLVLFGISSVTFLVTRVLGNPVYLLVGHQQSPEIVDNMVRRMGLDRPLYEQYLGYLWSVLHGDLGISRYTFRPVVDDIALRLPATLELVLFAMALVVLVGIPLGILAAVRRGSWWDHSAQAIAQLGASVPNFWLGLLFIYFLFFLIPVFPPPLGRRSCRRHSPSASGFICGNRMTSRILWASVRIITSRSMPNPSPPVGGIP